MSIASALYQHGIDCIWHLHFSNAPVSMGSMRIIEQLHDGPGRKLIESSSVNHTSFGIIIECNHGLGSSTDSALLPSVRVLEDIGIKKIVIFTEEFFNEKNLSHDFNIEEFRLDPQLGVYLSELEKKFDIFMMGTNRVLDNEPVTKLKFHQY
jgi:hypothetical protein